MKPSITALVIVATIALTISCKKKNKAEPEEPAPETPTYPSYSGLKTGNYWVYQHYKVEQNGTATNLNETDSCYISKDTLINGRTYYKMHKQFFLPGNEVVSYLRDSLHYLVNSKGAILFSSEDFTTVFNTSYIIMDFSPAPVDDTLYKMVRKMTDKNLAVQVPAGTFITSNMQSTYSAFPIVANPAINNPRYMNMRYAKGMGVIVETEQFFAAANYVIERRLIRYKMN